MNKNKANIKGTFDNIRPSDECLERIALMTKDNKKRIKLAPALGLVACMAIIITGIVGSNIIPAKTDLIKTNTTNGVVETVNNAFTIVAKAKDGEPQIITSDKEFVMQDLKIKTYYDENGIYTIDSSSDSAFEVQGENIKSVRYQCEKGRLGLCIDFNKIEYLEEQGKYYDFIVPYEDDLKGLNGSKLTEKAFGNYKNGKYDEYVKVKRPIDDYYTARLIYDDDENITGVGFLLTETYKSVSSGYESKDFTYTNYYNRTKDFNFVYWEPNLTELYTEDGKSTGVKVEELEHDTLSITVEFNDSSRQTVQYDLGFNANGELVVNLIKVTSNPALEQ